jgi:hypothetical protein
MGAAGLMKVGQCPYFTEAMPLILPFTILYLGEAGVKFVSGAYSESRPVSNMA